MPPAKPTIFIDRCVETMPPKNVPLPMPKLNIPEKSDIATAEALAETARIVSD